MLKRVIRNIKRVRDENLFKKRKSITKNVLLKILNILNVFTRQNVTLHAFFCFVFVVFFRIDEFIWFVADVKALDFFQWKMIKTFVIFSFDNLNLTLSFSKIDFFRKDVIITMTTTHDVVCAIDSLRHFFEIFFAFSNASLFEIVFEKLFFVNTITKTLREIFEKLNLQKHYFDHFFRRSVVTHVKNIDLFNDIIQLLDRWKFDVYRLYVNINKKFVFRVFRQFQNS